MARSSSKKGSPVKVSKQRLDELTRLLPEVREYTQGSMQELVHSLLTLLAEIIMNSEVIEKVGARSERNGKRTASRWGNQAGSVLLMEQRVPIDKPRVRTVGQSGHEVLLETYEALNDPAFLNEQAGVKLLAGLSTRNFANVLEGLLDGRGIGRQTISRRGIERMAEQLSVFKTRTFGVLEFPVVFIDGVGLGDYLFITAIGVDRSGAKHVLGFEIGCTENSGNCRSLLSDLIDRNILNADGGHIFVIDGGKGLRKALKMVFGDSVWVQRCVQHKKRNVLNKLPDYKHSWFIQRFSAAYSKKTFKAADTAFRTLRRELEVGGYTAAANSLLEGNIELLSLHRLKIEGVLRKSLCTTNIIESLFSNARYQMRNVKRWRKEEQAERWLAASLLTAEKRLRKVPGYSQILKLTKALATTAIAKI